MIYNLFISKAAIKDIEEAIEWYEKQRKGLGYELELCIEAGMTLLQRDPLRVRLLDVSILFFNRKLSIYN